MRVKRGELEALVTKDGSWIREMIHPKKDGPGAMSFAEAVVPPDAETIAHAHETFEEIYFVLGGGGRMRLGDEEFHVAPGEAIRILPGVVHSLKNQGFEDLVVLCCCSPPYTHEDTVLE
jgi:mannose-6-phosphate isomerase-like protein (cupin superfamily)